ncbi:MAG: dUTP diphosphatase [Bdellovibrionota bacterium]
MAESVLKFFIEPSAKEVGAFIETPRLGDAGFDLRAAEDSMLEPGEQKLVSTGLHVAIPLGWVGLIRDRSSMALKGIRTHAGVIDASYRGEIKVLLSNASLEKFSISLGDKITQMLIVPCSVVAEEVSSLEALGETSRGSGGFGSTGK